MNSPVMAVAIELPPEGFSRSPMEINHGLIGCLLVVIVVPDTGAGSAGVDVGQAQVNLEAVPVAELRPERSASELSR